MCGIAGFLTNSQDELTTDHLVQMGNKIAHRGPDASGVYLDDSVGLCHRRLSIIDLSEGGNQPMFSDDENVVLVFNGEIYNFLSLRETLEQQGEKFKSSSDTEVIIKLYQKYGVDCLSHLNGMFAFALWDKSKQELFIARDRLGKKPLYYYQDPEGKERFAFASEIKSILELPNIKRELRLDAVHDFFAYQYIPDPKSIFVHIHKLPPANYMIVKHGEIEITPYWDVSFAETIDTDEQSAIGLLREQISQATERRMVSDVPLGAFLSGGVDSGGIVATMAGISAKPVKTCTIAFDNEKFNEAKFAQKVADQYNTEHHEFLVHQNVAETLEHIVSFFDEPFADPSLVPTFFVSELARKEVTVAIAGDGGDELFAGYEKYTTDYIENQLREKFPMWMRKHVFPALAKGFGSINLNVCKRACSLFTSLSVSPDMGFYITNSQITDQRWQQLVLPDVAKQLGDYHPSQLTTEFYAKADGKDHLSKILYTDMKTYLTGGILVKVDRMSMANSLEVRAPILDKEIIELAATLPSNLKFRDKEKKYALKETFKPLLSDDILYRKKMGFSVPLAQWLREELKQLAQTHLVDNCKGLGKVFKRDQIDLLWQQHQSNSHDHSTVLWSMLMFELWWKRYMA